MQSKSRPLSLSLRFLLQQHPSPVLNLYHNSVSSLHRQFHTTYFMLSILVFLLTFAFTLFLVRDHIAEAGWKILFLILFYFLNQAWIEEKLYNNQGFSCILILGAATTWWVSKNNTIQYDHSNIFLICNDHSWALQHGLKQEKKINLKRNIFSSQRVLVFWYLNGFLLHRFLLCTCSFADLARKSTISLTLWSQFVRSTLMRTGETVPTRDYY